MRLIGWVLVVLGIAALVYNLWHGFTGEEEFRFFAFGEVGFRIFGGAYAQLQVGIERYVSPWLWAEIVLPITLFHAWAVLMVPGAVLIALSRLLFRRRRRRR